MNSRAATLVDVNRDQSCSETDSFTLERYAQFLRHFPSKVEDVLDIGCNTGRGGEFVKSRLKTVRITGLDCVPERLERLDRSVYSEMVCGVADQVDLPSMSFDAIVAGEIIEHIPGPLVAPTLHECFRLLRLKGRLLLTTPNPSYLRNRLESKSVLLDPSHVSQHSPGSLRRKLEDAGFSQIRVYGSGRMTRYLGEHFPLRSVYGSYLAVASKW